MIQPKRWYVVADAGSATAYVRRKTGPGYDVAESWKSGPILAKATHARGGAPGRVFDSTGQHRHMVEETTPADARRKAFGRTLAGALRQRRQEGAYDELVLFAAPRLLHELRVNFDAGTMNAIVHCAAKDLVKLSGDKRQALFRTINPLRSKANAAA